MALRSGVLWGLVLCWLTAGNSQEQRLFTPAGTERQMALIPAGLFLMGMDQSFRSPYGGVVRDSSREVFLPAYYIDRHEVTNAQYRAYVQATGVPLPRFWSSLDLDEEGDYNRPQQPVVGVSWFEAQAYCEWAGLRLPTGAEWEKAARGTNGRIYPWGDVFELFRGHFNGSAAVEVGSFSAGESPYGVMDMAGNVSEWVGEIWEGQIRGGSFSTQEPAFYRSATPQLILPESRAISVGFRCAVSEEDFPITGISPRTWGQVKEIYSRSRR